MSGKLGGVNIVNTGIRQYMLSIRLGWLYRSLSYCWAIGVWIRRLGIFLESGMKLMAKSMRVKGNE